MSDSGEKDTDEVVEPKLTIGRKDLLGRLLGAMSHEDAYGELGEHLYQLYELIRDAVTCLECAYLQTIPSGGRTGEASVDESSKARYCLRADRGCRHEDALAKLKEWYEGAG